MTATKYPSIPDPVPGSANADTLLALKQLMEMLIGARASAIAPHVRLFRTNISPGSSQSEINIVQLRDGDLWLDTSQLTGQLKWFDPARRVWVPIT